MTNSEIKISDVKGFIYAMSPIEIWIDNERAWADIDGLDALDLILSSHAFIQELTFKVFDFHHTIVYIKLCEGE